MTSETYTQAQLKTAFDTVCDPSDWKAPIDCEVDISGMEDAAGHLNLIRAAIVHFTATDCNFKGLGGGKVRITADGYRMGPAGG